MLSDDILRKYDRWLAKDLEDKNLSKELKGLSEEGIADAFYRDLEFGTGGLRGLIGAGTNRLNIYTVAKATQGVSNYILAHFKEEDRVVAISRDSRLYSDVFSEVAARVFAANGIKVWIYPYISPVPTLSFATRYLNCCVGIMLTASHNPAEYNGYKVYGADGCQITTEAAKEILSYIDQIDVFDGYKIISLLDGRNAGLINDIAPEVMDAYIDEVKKQSFLGDEKVDKDIAIIYSPLNGTGLVPITRTLKELGYTNITVVKEQEKPDGHFPTCPKPNPEERVTLELGIEYCKRYNADLMLATDPDCDRVGIAVKDKNGGYVLLSGNEVGILLLDYICSRRIALGTMPKNPVMIKTIATMDLAEAIADNYGLKTINVLTGFKFIGEQIGFMEKEGHVEDYVFGFEDSYGYLSGTYVRDKDAVNGAVLICEMFAYYKSKGLSLLDRLDELWKKYGYCLNTLHTFEFKGPTGKDKMNAIMDKFRNNTHEVVGEKIYKTEDYINGLNGLPKSNVLKFFFGNNCSIMLRPSGTEPKLKAYFSIRSNDKENAEKLERKVADFISKITKGD